ncbi:MFS transporter [Evansella clarkii]|uniref:MFS transporter n=1 Tax=Evansella clarkii TaxID=79879 RepID=UPI001116566C|nr:MFS transporter [Evansella clarkii]
MNQHKKTMLNMKSFYFFSFFALGGLFPLLSVYLQNEAGLSGAQIGTIMSVGPIVMLLSQPVWGMLSDYTGKPRVLLTVAVVITASTGLLYLFTYEYIWLLLIAALLALFQSPLVPLSDSMAMNYVYKHKEHYGNVRLWGAAGFAVAVWVAGNLSDLAGLQIIFYIFAATMLLSAVFSMGMPRESAEVSPGIKNGLGTLIKMPRFMIFLLVTFLVFGPIMANNFYFGLFIQFAGGSLAGVGFAFLLAAGSEVPFMRWAGNWIERAGILKILFIASLISGLRWLFYVAGPSPVFIYVTTIIQGFSIGLFIPAALQYVIKIAPGEIKATAVSLYSAAGNGLGAWFFTFSAGLLIDWFGILSVYLFYGVLTLAGAVLMLVIIRQEKQVSL